MNKVFDQDFNLALFDYNDEEILNEGVKRYHSGDYESAIEYYRIAAAMGNVTAQSNLGYCYYYGRSVTVDYTIAYAYFELAAQCYDINATYKLGDFYMKGKVVEKDPFTALTYYFKAYDLAKDEQDEFAYPDICLRLGKLFLGEENFLEEAVKGFEKRRGVDQFSVELYEISERLLEKAKQKG